MLAPAGVPGPGDAAKARRPSGPYCSTHSTHLLVPILTSAAHIIYSLVSPNISWVDSPVDVFVLEPFYGDAEMSVSIIGEPPGNTEQCGPIISG